MADHTIEFVRSRRPTDKPEWAQCACGQNSGWRLRRDGEGGTEEWATEHEAYIRRVRAGLQRRTPGLADTLKHYRAMADDPSVPGDQRAMWRTLADELATRAEQADGTVQETLFDDPA